MPFFGSDWLDDSDDGAMVPSSWKDELDEEDPEVFTDLDYRIQKKIRI